ncbi:MAG: sulfatase-like hydrolase/transferase [archaeon]
MKLTADKDLNEKNVLFITLDSCRYDTAQKANTPTIEGIDQMRQAYTHGSYTIPAHIAFFSGHLPAAFEEPKQAYYSECIKQLWRIRTGRATESKPAGIELEGNNILGGYEKLGFYILGAGGVTQFAERSLLRQYFKEFLYCSKNLDEEPLNPRKKQEFPLTHIDEIVSRLKGHDRWFLFINCNETHYPYDTGEGVPLEIEKTYLDLKKRLNLREPANYSKLNKEICDGLKEMQIRALEKIDKRIEHLIAEIPKQRNILTVICADHGENFGEAFCGRQRFGHLIPTPEVMRVPLVIGEINAKHN